MPIRVRYDIYDRQHPAPIFSTSDRMLAIVERDDGLRRGKGICRIKTTVIPDNMNKSEQYLYLVYEVRQLERQYFNGGRDKDVFRQALDKEKQLDDWNTRTRFYLQGHPKSTPDDAKAFSFFLLVEKWRQLWKQYFAYKKRQDADPAIVRERGKQCRDYESQIDNYIKQTLRL